MLGKIFPSKTKIAGKVVFREEAAAIGEHGSIYADSKKHSTVNDPVSFAFVGVTDIPALDVAVMKHIEDQAAAAGFIMRSLRSYATVMTVQPRPRLNMTRLAGSNANSAAVHKLPVPYSSNNGRADKPSSRHANAAPGSHYTNPTVMPRA